MASFEKKIVIITSENLCSSLIQNYIGQVDDFVVSSIHSNFSEALPHLYENMPDVIMIDYNLLEANTLNMLKGLQSSRSPLIVILANSDESAADSYLIEDVIDYIVKPFSNDRMALTLKKCRSQLRLLSLAANFLDVKPSVAHDFIFVKVNRKMIKISLDSILYIESVKDYIKIVCDQKNYLVYSTLSSFTDKLPTEKFMRVHRSYTVSLSRIDFIYHSEIVLGGKKIPFSRKYLSENKNLLFKYSQDASKNAD